MRLKALFTAAQILFWILSCTTGLCQFTLLSVAQVGSGGVFPGVAVSGNYAYLADDRYGLHIYEVSNPANPVSIFNTNNVGPAIDVAIVGQNAYVSSADGNLYVFDISNPTNA